MQRASPSRKSAPVAPSPVVGFSLATPNAGPEQAPAYANFSPLFTSTNHATLSSPPFSQPPPSANTMPLQTAVPIPIRRSPRLDAFSKAPQQNPQQNAPSGLSAQSKLGVSPNNQLASGVSSFSPSAFFSAPGSRGMGLLNTSGGLSNAVSPAVTSQSATPFMIPPSMHSTSDEMSAVGRYQRYMDEQGSEQQVQQIPNYKRQRFDGTVMMAPPSPTSNLAGLTASNGYLESFHMQGVGGSGGGMPVFPNAVLSGPMPNSLMGGMDPSMHGMHLAPPESTEMYNVHSRPISKSSKPSVGPGGSSCHQCKNRRDAIHLNFCRNRTRSIEERKRKICRKKYCDHCLTKFNYQHNIRVNKELNDWECPSCRGVCVCAACRRKQDITIHETIPVSPAFSFAQKIFSDPQMMDQQQRQQSNQ